MSNLKLFTIIFGLVLLTTACSFPFTSSPKETGGIFRSTDYGEKWGQKNSAVLDNKKTNISNVNTKEIVFDPHDRSLLYLATRGNGLFVSENSGEEWRQIFSTGFVYSVAPDPQSRGVIYFAVDNKIYKTIDQGKNWRQIYLENRTEVQLTQIAIDPADSQRLIMGTSNGEIFQSNDAGESWELSYETKDNVRKILINKKNSQIIYVATLRDGIYKTSDRGLTWYNLKEKYEDLNHSVVQYRFLALDPGVADGLFYASNFGIIKSADGGETWQNLKLLTPENTAIINTLALNPKDNKHIYYATNDTIYHSFDGGKTWLSVKAPTTRAVSCLIVDPETANVIYFGVAVVNNKPFFFL